MEIIILWKLKNDEEAIEIINNLLKDKNVQKINDLENYLIEIKELIKKRNNQYFN